MKPKIMGVVIISLFIFMALFAPVIAPYDPTLHDLSHKLQGPTLEHLLGTDGNGADVFSQILFGARLSLFVSLVTVLISSCIGLIFGSLAGYWGGLADLALMRTIEIFSAFPGFLLALSIMAFFGSSISNLILALSITGWTSYARVVRGEVLQLRSQEFVQAAHALGASDHRVIFRHITPNLWPLLKVQLVFGIAGVVISEAGLSFLGLGAPLTTPSWGQILAQGRRYIIEAPHISLSASLSIILVVMGLQLLLRKQT